MNTAFVEGQRVVFHRNGVVDDPGRPILKLSVMQGIYLEAVSAEELEMTFFHQAAERCILLMELFVPLLQRKVDLRSLRQLNMEFSSSLVHPVHFDLW